MIDCINIMNQYDSQINLPYNASYTTNESCRITQEPDETLVDAVKVVVLRQNTCAFGSCVTTFQYTTKVSAFLVLDTQCKVSDLTLETEPAEGWVHDQIQANQDTFRNRIEREIQSRPDLQQYCLRQ